MPTTKVPEKQAPMKIAGPASCGDEQLRIIDQQPVAEPRPEAEPQMSLRGGGFNIGCDCCDGSCRFNKRCC